MIKTIDIELDLDGLSLDGWGKPHCGEWEGSPLVRVTRRSVSGGCQHNVTCGLNVTWHVVCMSREIWTAYHVTYKSNNTSTTCSILICLSPLITTYQVHYWLSPPKEWPRASACPVLHSDHLRVPKHVSLTSSLVFRSWIWDRTAWFFFLTRMVIMVHVVILTGYIAFRGVVAIGFR